MQEAIHPHSSNLISSTDYVKFALDKGYQKTNDAPSTKCPVCNRNMKVRSGQKKMMVIFIIMTVYFVLQKNLLLVHI